ncbi:alpha-2-macroglobulin-like protein 1 isoform X1 [Haliotis cracherodii]|uniref:alpha-2-macroglobulin-like protein 1 isoform X1 n=1 Tax=Haliotis cracherodii TaxID=6455 RepID=UPI0039E9638A
MFGQAGAVALLSTITAFHLISAQPGYILTLPRTLRAGGEETFCVTLHDVDDPAFAFTLRLTHKETQEEHDFEYEISESYSQCLKFNVPTQTGEYDVVLRNDTSTIEATGTTEVEVKTENIITLVQTDKPIYKPGQRVQFRVLTLTRDLKTRTGVIQSIFIKTPNDIRVKQWLNVECQGVTSFKYPMPAEPTLGEWTIDVTLDGETTSQPFQVQEYVLPRFDVQITPPPFLLSNASTIDGKVCAEYTYGKPVMGYVSLEVCLTSYQSTERPCYRETVKFDGCYKFSVNTSEVEMANKKYYLYGSKLQINASVREINTAAVVNKTSTGPAVSYDPLKITLKDDTNGFFKPTFPYHGRAVVTTPDGEPAPGELIEVSLVDYRNDIRLSNNYTSDSDGIIHFSVCDIITEKTQDFSIDAKAVLYADPSTYYGLSNTLYMPRAYKTVKQWYSPSLSYIAIPRQSRTVSCGGELEVTVPYTTTLNTYTKFYYQVMSRGRILHTGHKMHHFLKHDSTEFLEVPMASCLQKVPDPSPPPEIGEGDAEEGGDEGAQKEGEAIEIVDPPAEMSAGVMQQGGLYQSLGVRRKRAPVIAAEMAGNDLSDGMEGGEGGEEPPAGPTGPPPPPPPSRHVSHFTLRVPVTEEMSPEASLLIYYVRDDGETVADSINFDVEACFKNKVKFDFLEKKVIPGREATLRLQAEPGSLCSIGMIDKSINILGGDHQLTPEKMFDILKKYGNGGEQYHYYKRDKEYCERKVNDEERTPEHEMYGEWWHYSSRYVDAVEAFRQMGMAVATNMLLETRPCSKEYAVLYEEGGLPGPGGGQRVLPLGIPLSAAQKKKPSGSVLRSYFPETWLWELEQVGDTGELELRKTTPHTITRWVGNTICTSQSAGVGVAPMTSLTTFQPFFLSIHLPYAAVRGERLPLHVTIFNYLEKCLYMQVNVETGDDITLTVRDHLKLPFCLCGGKSKTQSYYISAKEVGKLPVVARAEIVPGTCDNNVEPDTEYIGLSDAVKRELFVKVEGVTQEYTKSLYICPKDFDVTREEVELPLPEDIVRDSARGHVSVIGDIMGPALSNLDNLVQLPTGCGEQTMINFSPNIYVLKYLTFTSQLTDEMKLLCERYMEIGYTRELNYRHDDGSFSAFGKSDASGSTWLTAFVVKSFAQAQRFIYIDQTNLATSVSFLKSTRMENGCFREVGKVFSSYMMGGLGKVDGEDDTALTAFVVVALLEAHVPRDDPVLMAALRCLSLQPRDEMDTYTLTLTAYAQTLNDPTSQASDEVMTELDARVISNGVLGYWGRGGSMPDAVNTWHYRTAPSAEIEMTSYGLMATLLYYQDGGLAKGQPMIMWLSQQRNSLGGFASTQDTVLGLQAMSEFASKTFTGNATDLSVTFTGNKMSQTYDITTGVNTLLLQRAPIMHLPNTLSVSTNGTGCALIQANVQFNKLPENLGINKPLFNLTVAVRRSRTKRSDCARRSIRICVSFMGKKDFSAGMSMLTVKMVTAWTPVLNSLKELESVFPILSMKKYENDVKKGLIAFYFDELDVRKRCFEFELEQDRDVAVSDPKPAEIQAYQYYEKDVTIVKSYEITTTCGTKAEIPDETAAPTWLAGSPIEIQNRIGSVNDMPPLPSQKTPETTGCPACINEKPEDFDQLICQSKAIYKVQAGRNGRASMKIKADLRTRRKKKIDKFASFTLGSECQCDLLNPPNEKKRVRRLLILSNREQSLVQSVDPGSVGHVIHLGSSTIIINLDRNRKLEKETRKKARSCNRRS